MQGMFAELAMSQWLALEGRCDCSGFRVRTMMMFDTMKVDS
jgi:hypothetical protein